jgi:uncharacterized membrane protein YbhN (UPF0104 family)
MAATPQTDAKSIWIRRAVRVAAAAVSIVVVIGLLRALRRDGPAAIEAWRDADFSWMWILASMVCGLAGHLALIFGWRRLLVDSGTPATLPQTARLLLVSNLGRYLPAAKAWQMGIVALIASEADLPPGRVAGSSLFHGLVGVAVGAILLVGAGGAVLGIPPGWVVVPLAGVAALLAWPSLLERLPSVRAMIARRLPGVEAITARTMWTLVWTCALSWCVWGVGLFTLARGLLGDPGASIVAYVGAWIGPFLAGVASIVTPAGLGVRDEAMRTMLVVSGAPASGAIIVVLVARLWATILEVLPAMAMLALRRREVPQRSPA